MANSKHQQIVDAIVAALSATPAIAGAVHDGRNYALPKEQVSAIHVYLGDSAAEDIVLVAAPTHWTTQVEVLVKARRNGARRRKRLPTPCGPTHGPASWRTPRSAASSRRSPRCLSRAIATKPTPTSPA
jgi:hypothetical protein